MVKKFIFLLILFSFSAFADEIQALREEIKALKETYEEKIVVLEKRLDNAEKELEKDKKQVKKQSNNVQKSESSFNPGISVVLDAKYQDFEYDPEGYSLPGFQLGNEGSPHGQGFSVGHSEIGFSANVDDKFYGQLTAAIAEHDGETEIELEEAFVETLNLRGGFKIKAGRFFSGLGYLNQQHEHAWEFADAPLIYRGLFGNQLRDDGLQVSWIAPVDIFLQFGGEILHGDRFPAGGVRDSNFGAYTIFTNFGGDFSASHSWQAGLGYWNANDINDRESAAHDHGTGVAETPSFTGESEIYNVYFVYKWAPYGNFKHRNFTLQAEYFDRKEKGDVVLLNSNPLETSSYDGHQQGFYLQGVYQFHPGWRVGLRYDYLMADNKGSDLDVLEEAGMNDRDHNPYRYGVMLSWANSEFSRIRLQYNNDNSQEVSDSQFIIQYTMSLGAHGAHDY